MKNILLAILVNLCILLAIEGVFRGLDLAPKTTFFIPGEEEGIVVSNLAHFNPNNNFAANPITMFAEKPQGVKRIFMVGGSTAAGLHYNPHASIAKWMDLGLRDLLPDRTFEVINAGTGGKSSFDIVKIFEELTLYDPDLILIYTGQNEYLEPNIARFRRERLRPRIAAVSRWLHRSSTVSWFADKVQKYQKNRDERPFYQKEMMGELIAGEDFGPLAMAYQQNLRQMAQLGRQKGVPVLFLTPVSNIRDWEPNESYFSKELTKKQEDKFVSLVLQGKQAIDTGKLDEAESFLKQAEKIDFRVAELQWQRARLLDRKGKFQKARISYELATTLDGKPWRNSSDFPQMVRRIAQSEMALIYDTQERFRAASPQGLIGFNLMIDNCHPSLQGQFMIARGILATLAQNNILSPRNQWQLDQLRSEEEYLAELFPDEKTVAETFFRTGEYLLIWSTMRYDNRRRLRQAAKNFDAALEIDPRFAKALYAKGLSLEALGEIQEGQSLQNQAKEKNPDVEKELGFIIPLMEPLISETETAKEKRNGRGKLDKIFEGDQKGFGEVAKQPCPGFYFA